MNENSQGENIIVTAFSDSVRTFVDNFVALFFGGLLAGVISTFSFGLLAAPMVAGFVRLSAKALRGEQSSPSDVFEGFSFFGASLLGAILRWLIPITLILLGWVALALIPLLGILLFLAIIVAIFAFFIGTMFLFEVIALDERPAIESIKESIDLVKRNLGESVVCALIVFLLNAIADGTLILALLVIPLTLIFTAATYLGLREREAGGVVQEQPMLDMGVEEAQP